MIRKVFKIFLNRYVIATLAFAIWVIFFDNYSLLRQAKLKKQLNGIEEMKQYYHTQIDQNVRELDELETNMETLEKFAREKYLMKRDNEDVYVVIKE